MRPGVAGKGGTLKIALASWAKIFPVRAVSNRSMADDSCYLARSSPIGFAPQAGGTQNKTPVLALGRLARTATDGDAQLIPGIEQVLGPVGTRASSWAWALRGPCKGLRGKGLRGTIDERPVAPRPPIEGRHRKPPAPPPVLDRKSRCGGTG